MSGDRRGVLRRQPSFDDIVAIFTFDTSGATESRRSSTDAREPHIARTATLSSVQT